MKSEKTRMEQVNAARTMVQSKAVRAIVREFQTSERVTCVMCCGSGKTRVADRVIRKLKPATVVVCVPNLQLVKQFIDEMASEGIALLPVCSRMDGITPQEFGIDFATTSPQAIAAFLKSDARTKVIVSTYHSFSKIAKAAKTAGPRKRKMKLDLLVSDEAHRTAGRVAKTFSACLHNSECHFERRLFLTATPVVYSGDNGDIHSMDDQSVYGRRSYELPYRKGVELGIVQDFQTYVLQLPEDVHSSVLSELDKLRADSKTLAEHIAAHHVSGKRNRERVFAFHNRLEDSRQFCEDLIACGVYAEFITGADSVAERKRKIAAVMNHKGGSVLCSVKALAEGVDVPGITRILIADPKTSVVEITQIIGRGVRVSENKHGALKVLIPVFFVPNQELGSADFRSLRKVLDALRATDTEFNAKLRLWWNENRDESGEVKREDNDRASLIRLIRNDGTEVCGNEIVSVAISCLVWRGSDGERLLEIERLGREYFEKFGRLPSSANPQFQAHSRYLWKSVRKSLSEYLESKGVGKAFHYTGSDEDRFAEIELLARAYFEEHGKLPSGNLPEFMAHAEFVRDKTGHKGFCAYLEHIGIGKAFHYTGSDSDRLKEIARLAREYCEKHGKRPTQRVSEFKAHDSFLRSHMNGRGLAHYMDELGIGKPFRYLGTNAERLAEIEASAREYYVEHGKRPTGSTPGFRSHFQFLRKYVPEFSVSTYFDVRKIGKSTRFVGTDNDRLCEIERVSREYYQKNGVRPSSSDPAFRAHDEFLRKRRKGRGLNAYMDELGIGKSFRYVGTDEERFAEIEKLSREYYARYGKRPTRATKGFIGHDCFLKKRLNGRGLSGYLDDLGLGVLASGKSEG